MPNKMYNTASVSKGTVSDINIFVKFCRLILIKLLHDRTVD